MELISQANLQIQKSVDEVFEAIVNPEFMTKYFISESTGRLESGKEVFWKFPEFEESYLIKDVTLNGHEIISFCWDPETKVIIHLENYSNNNTVVKVTESGKELNELNLKWLVSNTAGWSNFLASLKAFMEYGIELRKGAYDFMKGDKNCS